MVSATLGAETSCFVGMPEKLFSWFEGVTQVGTLLYDPKSWGLEKFTRTTNYANTWGNLLPAQDRFFCG